MKRFLVGGCAALLLAACSQDPSLYLGGPPGAATKVQLSSGQVALTIGESATVGAVALDEVGNPTPDVPTFSACGGPASTSSATPFGGFTAAATVSAAPTTVGETCINVSAGGVSDTIHVSVGPAGLTIAGPDTLVSGDAGAFVATGHDATGAAVTGTAPLVWTTSSEALAITEFAAGNVTSRTPGTVSIRARAANGVVATKSLVVIIGTFTGTLSAANGSAGLQLMVTPGAGDDPVDANTAATYGGQVAYVEPLGPASLLVAVPATNAAGAQDLDLTNLGPGQTARRISFTANSATDDQFGTATDDPATAPSYVANRSPGGYVYFTHTGFGTGSAARGLWNGGAQQDHFFQFTTGATDGSVIATLEWTNAGTGADFDLEICKDDGSNCAFWVSGATGNELGTAYELEANTTYTVMTSCWTARNNIHNLRLKLVVTGTTIQ